MSCRGSFVVLLRVLEFLRVFEGLPGSLWVPNRNLSPNLNPKCSSPLYISFVMYKMLLHIFPTKPHIYLNTEEFEVYEHSQILEETRMGQRERQMLRYICALRNAEAKKLVESSRGLQGLTTTAGSLCGALG